MDHMISKLRGGPESADNIVWACRSCNSSKGPADLLDWMQKQDRFPPLLLLRRYLKLVIGFCESKGIMDEPLDQLDSLPKQLPFNPEAIPHKYPSPEHLVLWVEPTGKGPAE